jgi:cell wall-associated NlpC family hydrolase
MSKLLEFARSKVGCGYVWGANGEVLTQKLLTSLIGENGLRHYVLSDGTNANKWLGKQCFDCSGLIVAGLRTLTNYKDDVTADGLFKMCTPIGYQQLKEGDLVFIKLNGEFEHVGIFNGNGTVIEAHGTKAGVIIGDIDNFNMFGRLNIVIPNDNDSVTDSIVQALIKKGAIVSPDYWYRNLIAGGKVESEYVIKVLKKILGL